ncbi:NlpC/P60 family protein [Hyphomonas pacifica]|uniref:NlpC/P60 domain-containing protein n=1 Tax=Hyphomonas pacifica TaxID=1280941 RepID=A0A8B2PJ74_9PROT|nr:NlpC/P60 family protein [Hyphomonas pacifica]RAN30627.1 hypothetical protein HY3_05615 [Hyphomonas pacifica]
MPDFSSVPDVIGTPWILRGRDPVTGWDCLGCAEVMQARVLGTPELNSLGLYAADDQRGPAALFLAHFQAGVSLYRACAVRTAGAIILFRMGRRPVHCGLYLGQGQFLHASERAGTVISNLSDPDYARAEADYYLPA